MRPLTLRDLRLSCAAALLALSGCATVPPSLPQAPEARALPVTSPLKTMTSATGLTVVADAGAPGQFTAGLLFRGGPINDPPDLPGLTEWVAEAALLGTQGRDPATESPHQRALALGGSVEAVATGALVGWLVAGPPERSEELLELLFEVALRPSFPATRVSMAVTRNRDGIDARGDALIERAIAIALGQAVGLGRPLYMGPTRGMFERVTLAHTERHWRGMVQPRHGVLVHLGAPAPSEATLAKLERGWSASPDQPVATPELCAPQGRSAHLMVTPGSFGEHTIALWGSRAPGLGSVKRRDADALIKHLDSRAGGPIERLVGASQARRSSPDIIDLGHIRGRPIAAVLVGAAGPPERAMEDLDRLDQFLSGLSNARAIEETDAAQAYQRLKGGQRLRLHRPFHNALQRAFEALGEVNGGPTSAGDLRGAAAEIFAPWRSSLVLIGSMDLRERLSERAEVAIWSQEENTAPPEGRVRCVPQQGAP